MRFMSYSPFQMKIFRRRSKLIGYREIVCPRLLDSDELAELQLRSCFAIENALDRYVLAAFDLRESLGLVLTKPTSNPSGELAFFFFQHNRTLISARLRHRCGDHRVTSDDDFFAVVLASHAGVRPFI